MIGAEILIWGMEKQTHPYWSAIHHYLWDSNIGHCALKLTIPSNPENDRLVYLACRHRIKDKTRIPHFRIKRKIGDSIEDLWVIYFSWWPRNKLQEEFNDRLSANFHLEVEYSDNWKEYCPGTMIPQSGILREYFGVLYDLIFGIKQPLPKPIESIVHPHLNRDNLTEILQKKEAEFAALKEQLLSKADTFFKVNERYERLNRKHQSLTNEPRSSTINALLGDTKRRLTSAEKEFKRLDEEITCLWETHKRLSTELKDFKREYYHEVATIGASPRSIFLPLGEHLCYKKIMNAMHTIAAGNLSFDIMFYNCATAVREIVAASLSKQAKNADFMPHLFDTPFKLYHSICSLQKKLLDLRATEDPTKIPILPSYRLAAARANRLGITIEPTSSRSLVLKSC